ncbi:MAG: Clp protease N-terminal domain-containing protein [Actinomycetota bacterium]
MISLNAADLVVIASGALGISTAAALDLLDVAACETALAQADDGASGEPAMAAATLLDALVRHHPFRRANDLIAMTAAVQLLSVNGWQSDLDPPGNTRAALASLAAGDLDPAGLAAWLAPRLSPCPSHHLKERSMSRWLPHRNRPARSDPPFARMTGRARQVVVTAQDEARGLCHPFIGTEHLLLGVLADREGPACAALAAQEISADAVRQRILAIAHPGRRPPEGHIPFTGRAKAALELSLREATQLSQLFASSEHILLGLVREGHGIAAQVLTGLGADLDSIRVTVARLQGTGNTASAGTETATGNATASRDATGTRSDQAVSNDAAGEVDSLRREVTRLRQLLAAHGIEPDGHQETA